MNILIIFILSALVFSQSPRGKGSPVKLRSYLDESEKNYCPSSKNLSLGSGTYNTPPYDQGGLGTCYMQAFLRNISADQNLPPLSVKEAMIASQSYSFGGNMLYESDKILKQRSGPCYVYVNGVKTTSLSTGPFACLKSTPGIDKLYLSETSSIENDLFDVIFCRACFGARFPMYSAVDPKKRQADIINSALRMASGSQSCSVNPVLKGLNVEFKKLMDNISHLNNELDDSVNKRRLLKEYRRLNQSYFRELQSISALKKDLQSYGFTISTNYNDKEIQTYLTSVESEINGMEKKVNSGFEDLKLVQKKIDQVKQSSSSSSEQVNFSSMENLAIEEAGSIVYQEAQKTLEAIKKVFVRYGFQPESAGTLEGLIKQRVVGLNGDVSMKGSDYHKFILKKAVEKELCTKEYRVCFNPKKTFKMKGVDGEDSKRVAMTQITTSLNKGKGVIISAPMSIFSGNTADSGGHAVNVIGCRVGNNGRAQYLIRNSWGNRCQHYSSTWDCESNGDVWIDAKYAMDEMVRHNGDVQWFD
jgi:hypothetical protein